MAQSIEKLDAPGYRKFGLTTGAILVVLFGLLIPWIFDLNYAQWPWWLGGGLAATGLLVPMALQPIYVGWMKFGNMMNWINTRLILGALFYLVFLPIGLVLRLFGKDSMHRKLNSSIRSYRVISPPESKDNVERPY